MFSKTGIPIHVSIVTNPSIKIQGKNAILYLRIASQASTFSDTFIAKSTVPVNDLQGATILETEPLLHRIIPYECVEDPRTDLNLTDALYHVRAYYLPSDSYVFTFKTSLENN